MAWRELLGFILDLPVMKSAIGLFADLSVGLDA